MDGFPQNFKPAGSFAEATDFFTTQQFVSAIECAGFFPKKEDVTEYLNEQGYLQESIGSKVVWLVVVG